MPFIYFKKLFSSENISLLLGPIFYHKNDQKSIFSILPMLYIIKERMDEKFMFFVIPFIWVFIILFFDILGGQRFQKKIFFISSLLLLLFFSLFFPFCDTSCNYI